MKGTEKKQSVRKGRWYWGGNQQGPPCRPRGEVFSTFRMLLGGQVGPQDLKGGRRSLETL